MRPTERHLLALAAVLTGVSACTTTPRTVDAQLVADAGTVVEADLVDFPWEPDWRQDAEADYDSALPTCHALTQLDGGPSSETVASATVQYEATGADAPGTLIVAQTLVYSSSAAADAALIAIDAELLIGCIGDSVPDFVPDAVPLEGGRGYGAGDDEVSFDAEMDDYVFGWGNDNTHVFQFAGIRVGPVVVFVQFGYSIQRPEDLPTGLGDAQESVLEAVTGRLEAALD